MIKINAQTPKLTLIGRVISGLSILPFIPSTAMKLLMRPEVTEGMVRFGFSDAVIRPLAVIEGLCVLLYLCPKTAYLGAILLTGYLGGAIVTHLRVGDPFIVPVVLGVLVWLGLYLRDARLRDLFCSTCKKC